MASIVGAALPDRGMATIIQFWHELVHVPKQHSCSYTKNQCEGSMPGQKYCVFAGATRDEAGDFV
jgi:hypothetical protein